MEEKMKLTTENTMDMIVSMIKNGEGGGMIGTEYTTRPVQTTTEIQNHG